MELLHHYGIDLTGKRVTIVGRSLVVGKPLSMLMLKENATVTICHTRTKDVKAECQRADIVVACAGVAKLLDHTFFHDGQVVVDVGIHSTDEGLCGDVDLSGCDALDIQATPVPGGVGTVTTSVLLKHVVSRHSVQLANKGELNETKKNIGGGVLLQQFRFCCLLVLGVTFFTENLFCSSEGWNGFLGTVSSEMERSENELSVEPSKKESSKESSVESSKQQEESKESSKTSSVSSKPPISESAGLAGGTSASDWNLILVSAKHPLPDDFSVSLASVGNGHKGDKRVVSSLNAMIAGAKSRWNHTYGVFFLPHKGTVGVSLPKAGGPMAQKRLFAGRS